MAAPARPSAHRRATVALVLGLTTLALSWTCFAGQLVVLQTFVSGEAA